MIEDQGAASTSLTVTTWEAIIDAENVFPPDLQLPLSCQSQHVYLDQHFLTHQGCLNYNSEDGKELATRAEQKDRGAASKAQMRQEDMDCVFSPEIFCCLGNE